ncbi:MAG: hypothetical protein AAGB22_02290 [Bacteroidota bacterium]
MLRQWLLIACFFGGIGGAAAQLGPGWERTFELTDRQFEAGMVHRSRTIGYDTNQVYPQPEFRPQVDSIAAFLLTRPRLFVRVQPGNDQLTEARAKWLMEYWVDYGIAQKRLTTGAPVGRETPAARSAGVEFPELVLTVVRVWEPDTLQR